MATVNPSKEFLSLLRKAIDLASARDEVASNGQHINWEYEQAAEDAAEAYQKVCDYVRALEYRASQTVSKDCK